MSPIRVDDRGSWCKARDEILKELQEQGLGEAIQVGFVADSMAERLYGPCPDPAPPEHKVLLEPSEDDHRRIYGHARAGKTGGQGYVEIQVSRGVQVDLDTAEVFAKRIIDCVAWGREYAS